MTPFKGNSATQAGGFTGGTMSKYANKAFWVDTFDRALASFAQGLIATAGLDGAGILEVDWMQTLSLAGSYAALSLLGSVAFRGSGESKSA